MLMLQLDSFVIEIDDGSIKNVGPTNKSGTAKLFDVADATAREFGDKRVKIVCEDGEGNEVQIALFPEEASAVAEDIERLQAESPVFE